MDQLNDITQLLALTLGVAWASGINLYAAVAMLGILGATGQMTLPAELSILADPVVIAAAAFMYCVEFFADKIPGVDTGWDALHTFVRIPAGAVLAAAAIGDMGPAAQLAAALLGGGLTAATHAAKAGTRVVINTSPEPVSNWSMSLAEDAAVFGGLWAALNHPMLFLGFLLLFVLALLWFLPKLWRVMGRMWAWLRRKLRGGAEPVQANDR